MDVQRLTEELNEAVGQRHVSTQAVDTATYTQDTWPRRLLEQFADPSEFPPAWIVWPAATAEVSQVVRIAHAHELAVVPYGAGSSLVGGAGFKPDRPTVVLDTKRMCQVLELDETSLTLHAQAGITGCDLEQKLSRKGYALGHMPSSLFFSTLGGWLAVRSAGRMMTRYGRIDQMCMGVTAVLPDGSVIHTRVAPRRATGPDLMHLLLGSEGTLGVITSAYLRVLRRREARLYLAAVFKDRAAAVRALGASIGGGARPPVAAVLSPDDSLRFCDHKGHAAVCLFEGPEPVVTAERDLAAERLKAHGGSMCGPDAARFWWQQRYQGAFDMLESRVDELKVVDEVDVAASWTQLSALADAVEKALKKLGADVNIEVGHFNLEGGCVLCQFRLDAGEKTDRTKLHDRAWDAVLKAARNAGGSIAHHRGAGRQRTAFVEEELGLRLKLLRDTKKALDPKGIMNPGVLGV